MKSSLRQRADRSKGGKCKNLIAVLEEPSDLKNIGTTIRNINALGVEKLYIVDSKNIVPKEWDKMREKKRFA
jgi:tRNA (guanosine-2'-O-)-methyltransferase